MKFIMERIENHKRGSLTIVGSGIKAVSHLTLEALNYIDNADIVYYTVSDPETEMLIRKRNPNSIDLYEWYDDNKLREETYIQMAEMMLQSVRSGKNTVGVFYGNPAVFAAPTHRAINIAKSEGYEVKMLPGISSIDCLFADLGVDPAVSGCQIFEASDLLLHNRQVNLDQQLIILQAGSVGNFGFNFKGFNNDKLDVLIDFLIDKYGGAHEVIHYIANIFFFQQPLIERTTLFELKNSKKILNGISTLYIPPKTKKPLDKYYIEKLGFGEDDIEEKTDTEIYGDRERFFISKMQFHKTPENYKPVKASWAFYEAIYRLSTSVKLLNEFESDPARTIDKYFPSLNEDEKFALLSKQAGVVKLIMQGYTRDDIFRIYGATATNSVGPNSPAMHVTVIVSHIEEDVRVVQSSRVNLNSSKWRKINE